MRRDDAAVRQQLTGVVEHDDPVAQQDPALLGVGGQDAGRVVVGRLSRGAFGLVRAHLGLLRYCSVGALGERGSRSRVGSLVTIVSDATWSH